VARGQPAVPVPWRWVPVGVSDPGGTPIPTDRPQPGRPACPV